MCSRYERGLLICIMSWRKNTPYHLGEKEKECYMMLPDSNLAARHRISEIVPCQLKESMCKKNFNHILLGWWRWKCGQEHLKCMIVGGLKEPHAKRITLWPPITIWKIWFGWSHVHCSQKLDDSWKCGINSGLVAIWEIQHTFCFKSSLGIQIRYVCPAVLTAGYSTGSSLFESVFVSRHRQTSAFSFVLLFGSPRIPHMYPPWTSYRWPWTWRRRPRGGRWPYCPSAACARRMQRFGKVQSSAHHHTPCQWWLAIKDHQDN